MSLEPPRGYSLLKTLLIGLPLLVLALMPLAPAALRVRSARLDSQKAVAEQRWQDAAASLRSLYEMEPWRVDLLEPMADYSKQAGFFAQARGEYDQALTAKALSIEGRLAYTGLLLQAGERETGLQILTETSKMNDLTSDQFSRILAIQRQYQDESGAIGTVNAWAKAKPLDGKAQYALGVSQIINSPVQAVYHLQDSSRMEPALNRKAVKIMQAVDEQRNAADAAYGWVLLGQGLAAAQEWQAAEKAFSRAVELSPEYAEAWALRAEALQQAGLDGQAALEQAQALNPKSNVVRAVAAMYWRRQQKPETALAILKSAAADQPDSLTWLFELGATLAETGDTAGALTYFQDAVQKSPDSTEAWYQLAQFCVLYGVDTQNTGLSAAREALRLAPEDAKTLDLVGWMLLTNRDAYTAERFLQQALGKDNWNPVFHLHLAQVFLQTGRLKEAEDHLRRAVELDPDGSTRLQAERLLARYFGENEPVLP